MNIGPVEVTKNYSLKFDRDTCNVYFRNGTIQIGSVTLNKGEIENFVTALRGLIEHVEAEKET